MIDAVGEILNVGMGSAAASLSDMVNDEIQLSLPNIDFVDRKQAKVKILDQTQQFISGVQQNFKGVLGGKAVLIFAKEQGLELVRAVLQQNELSIDELTDLEQEAMTEIGNVILNACLCSMADMLGNPIQSEIPDFFGGSVDQVFSLNDLEDQRQNDYFVMLLNMDFAIKQKNIHGYVIFMIDPESIDYFKDVIKSMFEN